MLGFFQVLFWITAGFFVLAMILSFIAKGRGGK